MMMMILLAFPVLEAVLLFKLAGLFGWWLLLYLVLAAIFGWVLIMDERMVVFGRIVQTMEQGRHPLFALFASARKMVAGVLLIVPGVMTSPIKSPQKAHKRRIPSAPQLLQSRRGRRRLKLRVRAC